MKKYFAQISFLFLLACLKVSCTTTEVPAGTKIADLTLPNQDGEKVSLSQLIESSEAEGIVLFFYPKDDSSLCTQQVQLIQKSLLKFAAKNYIVLGVSQDSVESHKKFSQEYHLTYPLLSDEKGLAQKAFSLGSFFSIPNRTTVILDRNLRVQHPPFVHNTSASRHIEYALSALGG